MTISAPAGLAFRGAVSLRSALYDAGLRGVDRPPIPVVSVGNLTVGGTGKTPISAWLAGRLLQWGRRPAIVVRGYGEDETRLHQELNPGVPVIVAPERAAGVRSAAGAGADLAILDDGFQHRKLQRSLDIVLIAAEQWLPPRRMLPRGPWREHPSAAGRADLVLVTRKTAAAAEAEAVAEALRADHPGLRVGIVHLQPSHFTRLGPEDRLELESAREMPLLAVCAIGEPRLFAGQLGGLGADVELMAFPDHHEFTDSDIRTMTDRAAGRPIVLSHKDAVKLRDRLDGRDALVLHQGVGFEEGGSELDVALRRAIG